MVVFFLIGPWLINRIGVRGAAVLAAIAGIVRWSFIGFTNSVLLLSLLQPLHGLTFALLHLACMRVLGTVVPAGLAATAQALYAFGAALVTAILMFFAGTFMRTMEVLRSCRWQPSASLPCLWPGTD